MHKIILTSALLSIATMAVHGQQTADVRVSNSYLQTTCVDAKASAERKWDLPKRDVSMTFTMKNQPRPGRPDAEAGLASIAFTPEPGHVYEIEVRSDPQMYSTRVWPKGEWKPVVRDRTTNQIISGEPQWSDAPQCGRDRRD